MFDMAMDIVNLPKEKRIPSELMRIFAKNKFVLSENNKKLGFETTFWEDDNMVFLMPNDTSYSIFSKREDWNDINLIAPETTNYEEKLSDVIKTVSDKIKIWLDSIIQNKEIDANRVNYYVSAANVNMIFQKNKDDPWQPKLCFSYKSRNLSDHIIMSDFIIPITQNKGSDFNRLRQCPECKKYFYALDMRKNFCSSICRSRMFNKVKREETTN